MAFWNRQQYLKWKSDGQYVEDTVESLNISWNCVTENESSELENLTNLKELYCGVNNLTSLNKIVKNLKLKKLYCNNNFLTTLNEIKHMTSLQILDCTNNMLTSLEGVNNFFNMIQLNCSNNKLLSLNGIQNLVNLEKLICHNNLLVSLNGIENLMNLKILRCHQNNLTSLNEIENLTNLKEISYYSNPIDHIPPNVNRLLNTVQNGQNIYEDFQNVHNHFIQESVKKSINNILKIKPLITNANAFVLNDKILTKKTKNIISEFSKNKDVHSSLNLTFEELLLYVLNRIETNTFKNEIKQVLNQEMQDADGKCFTGAMSRLINCLNGFDDLVKIEISDNEQISQKIIAIEKMLKKENKYSVNEHKKIAKKELIDIGYDENIINLWINSIE